MAIHDLRAPKRATMTGRRGAIAGATIDTQRLALALAMPGIDPRAWIVAGTVGVLDENQEFSTTRTIAQPSGPATSEATYADRLGVVVDVRTEPDGDFITAHYAGVAVGRFGRILIPIRGGDSVIVAIPGGDPNSPDKSIIGFLSDQTAPIPEDWNNDRVLFDLNVPFEVRAPAMKLTSANLQINGRRLGFGSEGI